MPRVLARPARARDVSGEDGRREITANTPLHARCARVRGAIAQGNGRAGERLPLMPHQQTGYSTPAPTLNAKDRAPLERQTRESEGGCERDCGTRRDLRGDHVVDSLHRHYLPCFYGLFLTRAHVNGQGS